MRRSVKFWLLLLLVGLAYGNIVAFNEENVKSSIWSLIYVADILIGLFLIIYLFPIFNGWIDGDGWDWRYWS